ncbi:YuiB family protein [Peribacillus kribbensis]|uniref:YuiB family protein n=1 Tax=Peribacillus kribbensis TaxID=356658 RepID=UPI00042118F9|nr:YuiB family protein [Peribacillus kribbensis]
MNIAVLIISMVLFFVLLFGIGFILNMLLRKTWVVAIVYPLIALMFINDQKISSFYGEPGTAFPQLGHKIQSLHLADLLILLFGFMGALGAGMTIRTLRERGYRMF